MVSRHLINPPVLVIGILALMWAAVAVFLGGEPAVSRAVDSGTQLRAGATAIAQRQEYGARCAGCHGDRGQGGIATIDFSSAPAVAALSRASMIASLENRHAGRLSEALSNDQAARIVDFVREYLMLPAPFSDASEGRRIYSETCSVCHGERGDGASWAQYSLNPPPRDFASADASALTRADMIAAVTFGKDGTAMMPFATQLTPEQVAATVDYIRNAFMEPSVAADEPASAETPQAAYVSAGNISVGRALYHANCEQCHGREGDGNGRRAYFMVIKPADFTSAAFKMRMDEQRLHQAIAKGVVGSPMPAWDKVLPDDKIADLAAYVNAAFVNPETSDEGRAPGWSGSEQKKN